LNAFFISALQQYGYPVLWLIVFVAAAGAPISGSLLLFAAGAFAALGDFNIVLLFPVALSAAVMGDNLGYFIGRRVGSPLLVWFERQKRFRFISPRALARGRVYFKRRTAWAIFITRFLIVVLGGPINFLAGVEHYPYRDFLFWDVSGQILGAIIPLGLGYAFAASWEEVASIFGAFSTLFLALLVAGALSLWFVRKIGQSKRASTVESEMSETLLLQDGKTGQDMSLLLMADGMSETLALQDGKTEQDTSLLPISSDGVSETLPLQDGKTGQDTSLLLIADEVSEMTPSQDGETGHDTGRLSIPD
jgi:membrane-associated protein